MTLGSDLTKTIVAASSQRLLQLAVCVGWMRVLVVVTVIEVWPLMQPD